MKGVTIAPLLPDGSFDTSQREYVRCNLLLLACGLIPEQETIESLCDGGPAKTPPEGIFVCGNADAPCDLVDQVTQAGLLAGMQAARFAMGTSGAASMSHDTAVNTRHAEFAAHAKQLLEKHVSEPKGRLADLQKNIRRGCKPIACTVCPTGCIMQIDETGNTTGNACSRGVEFAHTEISSPTRLFTGTVKIEGAADGRPLVSVRTAQEVPREAMLRIARACKRITAHAPIESGHVIRRDIAGSGVELIATADVAAQSNGPETADVRKNA